MTNIDIQNVNQPDKTYPVNAAKYWAMRNAYLAAIPAKPPGMTVAELKDALLPHLPDTEFPGGATAGWWQKAVQLDLEAKGIVKRSDTTPLRVWRAK